jgi:hypothetical protein
MNKLNSLKNRQKYTKINKVKIVKYILLSTCIYNLFIFTLFYLYCIDTFCI